MSTAWTPMKSADSWEAWDKAATEMGAVVKALKDAKAAKEEIDPAVAELLHRKEQLRVALEAAIEAAPDDAAKEALRAKLPPAPKGKDKKKDKGAATDAEKEANKAENERLKAEARAKKKAEAEKKKAGGDGAAAAAAPKAKPAADAAPAPGGTKGAAPANAAAPPAAAATAPKAAPMTGASKKPASYSKNTELLFAKDKPPLLAILTARLAKQELVLKRVDAAQLPAGATCVLVFPMGRGKLHGESAIARYFARVPPAAGVPSLLYGTPGDAMSASLVDECVEGADALAAAAGPDLKERLAALNRRLAMRATLSGHALGLADAAVWLALKRNGPADKAASSGQAGAHVKRWLTFVDAFPGVSSVAEDFFGVQKDMGSTEGIKLTDAEVGKVVTRFPPEPSGHLHIGHVKAALLNAHYAAMYEGTLLLRFDDTNPSKEKEEYEEAIVRDLKRLQITPAKVSWTSDHFPKIMEKAKWMIKQGLAYVDPSPQEEQQKGRYEKKDSPYRTAGVEENMRLFNEMCAASEEGLKCCLRAKIDMQSNNGALRDPTIFRCNLEPHAKTGTTYKAYPTYDLACPIVDSLEGVTHALRDNQYSDRNAQYDWFLENLKLRKVHLEGFSRINFVRTLLSKRKLQWLVDNKQADDWDDPRFPTVAGILRRGMTVDGLKKFILSMGSSKNTNLMSWDKIWAMNRDTIDSRASRYMALLSEGLVPVTIAGAPAEPYVETLARHPKDESLGKKTRIFAPTVMLQADDAAGIAEGEEVTLMSWGNIIVKKVHKGADGKVARMDAELHLAGDVKKTKKKLTWLGQTADLVKCTIVDLDFLITKDKPEENDKLQDILTPNSVFEDAALGEAALRTVRKGDVIQIERRGFYICDAPYVRPSEPVRLLFVPDGKNLMGVKRA